MNELWCSACVFYISRFLIVDIVQIEEFDQRATDQGCKVLNWSFFCGSICSAILCDKHRIHWPWFWSLLNLCAHSEECWLSVRVLQVWTGVHYAVSLHCICNGRSYGPFWDYGSFLLWHLQLPLRLLQYITNLQNQLKVCIRSTCFYGRGLRFCLSGNAGNERPIELLCRLKVFNCTI